MNEASIERASRECELAGQGRPEEPRDADDGKLKGRRGDDEVSGP
jgi:hypothetical protein